MSHGDQRCRIPISCLTTLFLVFAGCSSSSSNPETPLGESQETSVVSIDASTATSTSDDIISSPETTVADGPDWIYGSDISDVGDFIVAPYVQTACDIMRTELRKNLANPKRVGELLAILDELVQRWGLDAQIATGRPEPSTYTDIWISVELLVDYFRKLPENDYHFPISHSRAIGDCDAFNFTPENSRFARVP